MNGFNSGPIGMPMQLVDEAAFARMFPNALPAAFAAFQQGFRNRGKLGIGRTNEPPLRRHMKSAQPATLKESITMPVAVATPRVKAAPPATSPPIRTRSSPHSPSTSPQI